MVIPSFGTRFAATLSPLPDGTDSGWIGIAAVALVILVMAGALSFPLIRALYQKVRDALWVMAYGVRPDARRALD